MKYNKSDFLEFCWTVLTCMLRADDENELICNISVMNAGTDITELQVNFKAFVSTERTNIQVYVDTYTHMRAQSVNEWELSAS